jgi:hypothetical protein
VTLSGPLVKIKVTPLHVKRGGCFRVLMRNLHTSNAHGRWEPISTTGFVVICPSKLEACELVLLIGGRYFGQPADQVYGDDKDDERYLNWLLAEHFRIDPMHESDVGPFDGEGIARKRMQVMFSTFLKGWYPSAQDLNGGTTLAASIVEPALRARWSNR